MPATLDNRTFRVRSKKHDFRVEVYQDPLLLQRHMLKHLAGVGNHPEWMEKWINPPDEKVRLSREIRNKLQRIPCYPAKTPNNFDWFAARNPCFLCGFTNVCFREMAPYLEAYISTIEHNVRLCFEGDPRHAHYMDYRPDSFTCLSDNLVLVHAVAMGKELYNTVSCYSLAIQEGLTDEEYFDFKQDQIHKQRENLYARSSIFLNDPLFCTPGNWNIFA